MAPIHFDFEGRWRALCEEVIVGIKEWRLQHPQATLQEIERCQFLSDILDCMRRSSYPCAWPTIFAATCSEAAMDRRCITGGHDRVVKHGRVHGMPKHPCKACGGPMYAAYRTC